MEANYQDDMFGDSSDIEMLTEGSQLSETHQVQNQVHMFFHYECFPIVVGDSFYRLHPLFSHNLSSQFWGLGGLLLGSQSCYQSKISTVLGSEDVLESYHGLWPF